MSSVDAAPLHQYEARRAVGSDSKYFQNYQMPRERFQARDGRKTAFVFADGVSECSSRSQIDHTILSTQSRESCSFTRKQTDGSMDHTK